MALLLSAQIEAILFYKAEPLSVKRLAQIFNKDETEIKESQILGTAGFRIPFIGYIKIGFVRAVCYDPIEKIIKYVNPNLRC